MDFANARHHTTRIDVDAERHVTVDWAIHGYYLEGRQWIVGARCRAWRSTELRSGVHLAVRPLTPVVDVEVSGPVLEQVLATLMQEAYTRCLAALEH